MRERFARLTRSSEVARSRPRKAGKEKPAFFLEEECQPPLLILEEYRLAVSVILPAVRLTGKECFSGEHLNVCPKLSMERRW